MHRPQQQAPILPRFLENHATHKYDSRRILLPRDGLDGLLSSQNRCYQIQGFPQE